MYTPFEVVTKIFLFSEYARMILGGSKISSFSFENPAITLGLQSLISGIFMDMVFCIRWNNTSILSSEKRTSFCIELMDNMRKNVY